MAGAYALLSGVYLRTYEPSEGWSENIPIESHLNKPLHPSVAWLGDGRCVVAYACDDGIMTVLVDPLAVGSGSGRQGSR